MKSLPPKDTHVVDTRDNTLWLYCCEWYNGKLLHLLPVNRDLDTVEFRMVLPKNFYKYYTLAKERQ